MAEVLARKYRRGLVLGKFMPPHLGHLHLIEVAQSQVEQLTVLVCTLQREPINGSLRYAWMRELCPQACVLHITDENPAEPKDDPNFWNIWTDTIRRHVPEGLDVVFTSESYGDELAARLGARHVKVDQERHTVPVSATMIRQNLLEQWHFIPPSVRPYFVKRICITGSESTGKTTLAAELATYFHTVWNPEYGRRYLDAKPTPLDAMDIEPIAQGQIDSEDAAARIAHRVLLLDTDIISTIVYSEHYYDFCPVWIKRVADERRANLYLLTGIDVPWIGDPQRDRPHLREHMHELFQRELESRGLPYVHITGTWNERRTQAISSINKLITESVVAISQSDSSR